LIVGLLRYLRSTKYETRSFCRESCLTGRRPIRDQLALFRFFLKRPLDYVRQHFMAHPDEIVTLQQSPRMRGQQEDPKRGPGINDP